MFHIIIGSYMTLLNTLTDEAVYRRHEISLVMSDFRQCPWEIGSAASREGGAGRGGWVHPKGADSMAVFGLSLEGPLVGAQRATSVLLCTNGLRKQSSRLVGPPFLAVKHFSQR